MDPRIAGLINGETVAVMPSLPEKKSNDFELVSTIRISMPGPVEAERLYLRFVERCRALGAAVETGVFRADMAVELVNDGPVTFLLDSRKAF